MRIYGWFGILLLFASEYCLYRKIEPFTTWFYCFAWWSYILLADNLLLKLRGRSLLSGKRHDFWIMLPLSIFIWLIFEAYNFKIRNWSYAGVPSALWVRWAGYALAFSTVLPGIFITSDIVDFFFDRKSSAFASECESVSTKRRFSTCLPYYILGVILSVSPLIWPRFFFPAVWLGFIFLLNPLLEKAGAQSLSLSNSSGSRRRVWSLMLGGLLCGLMWEFWNFWAGSKWIYTVPFFQKWKLFEMPVPGFLGFPPFALECWIMYHLLKSFLQRLNSTAAHIIFWLCLSLLSVIIIHEIDRHTVVQFAEFFQRSHNPCSFPIF